MAKKEKKRRMAFNWIPALVGLSGLIFLSQIGVIGAARPYGAATAQPQTGVKAERVRKSERHGTWQRFGDHLMSIYLINLLVRTFKEFMRDDAIAMAGGVSYFTVIALFPLLLGIMSILGWVLPSESVQATVFSFIQSSVPGAADMIREVIQTTINARGALGIVSLIGLIWSGSAIFGTIDTVVNRAWDVNVKRKFPWAQIFHILMELSTGLLFILSMVLTGFVSVVRGTDLPFSGVASDIIGRITAFALVVLVYAIVYKLMPLTKTHWQDVFIGGLVASVLFELARSAFTYYITNLTDYTNVYGSIASVITLFVWIYYSSFVLLFGAEIASENYRIRNGIERGSREECAPEGPGGRSRGSG